MTSSFTTKFHASITYNENMQQKFAKEDMCVVHKINKVENVQEKREFRLVKFSKSTIAPLSNSSFKGFTPFRELNIAYIDKSPIVLSNEDVNNQNVIKKNQTKLQSACEPNRFAIDNKWSMDNKIYKVFF